MTAGERGILQRRRSEFQIVQILLLVAVSKFIYRFALEFNLERQAPTQIEQGVNFIFRPCFF